MISELSFLLELILDETTPQPIKTKLVKRIKEVEKSYATVSTNISPQVPRGKVIPNALAVQAQSPSMQRIMADNPDLIPKPPVPVTASAAQALAARQSAINQAISGKEDKDRVSPRKF